LFASWLSALRSYSWLSTPQLGYLDCTPELARLLLLTWSWNTSFMLEILPVAPITATSFAISTTRCVRPMEVAAPVATDAQLTPSVS
jgi:hypothetical protein